MTDHLFDTFIREKLADHKAPVPGGLWDKIEAATIEKEKRRNILLLPRTWRVAALLAVCAAASAVLFRPGSSDKRETAQKNTKTITTEQQSSDSVFFDKTITHQPAATEVTNNNTGIEGNAQQTLPVTPKPEEIRTANAVRAQQEANTIVFNNTQVPGSRFRADKSNNPYRASADLTKQAAGNTATAAIQERITEDNAILNDWSVMQDAGLVHLSDLSSYRSKGLRQILNEQSAKMLPIIRCPQVRNTVPKDLYIEAYASPDRIVKQTSARYGGETYLASKDSSQRLQTSFTAGIRISKALTENLLIKTGLQYSQVNELFNYRLENERKQVTVITTHTITRPQGDTVLRDTSSYEQIGYLQKKTYNKYKSIDIPVIFSYEWGNEQWRLAASLGAIINLRSWYKGEMLDTAYRAVSVKNTSGGVYKKNIGMGLYAGFSIIKPVSEYMDLFAEPYFRYNLSNMTNEGQPFTQKLHTAGLSLGIRYRLNGRQHF